VDVKEIKTAGHKWYQSTALDDCTRYRILRLYPRKNHLTSLEFCSTIRHALPVAIRQVQVANGPEFSLARARAVQEAGMRLRYITPQRPEQNGKVERSPRVDDEEFRTRHTFTALAPAATALLQWQHTSNHDRFSRAVNASPQPRSQRPSRHQLSLMQAPGTPCSPADRSSIVDPAPTVQAVFSQPRALNSGATS
jgi:transposase InsO family protein